MIKRRIIYTSICLLTSFSVYAETIAPFTSDGCSLFPDGTFEDKTLWLSCCTSHDIAYWQGGTSKQRKLADVALKQCVANVGQPQLAKLMLAGVRVGGTPYLPTQFRWGYGWSYFRGYQQNTVSEQQNIDDALATYFKRLTKVPLRDLPTNK